MEEFQEAIDSFEGDYKKSIKVSSEAAKVIIAYQENDYKDAIEYVTQTLKMAAELAKEQMNANEEYKRLNLKIKKREEKFKIKIESLKRDRHEYEKNVEAKMAELQANIEQQSNSHEEMKKHLEEKNYL